MAVPIWAGCYIGLPFRELGRDRKGLDCWGLVRLVLAEQFSIPLPSYAGAYANTLEEQAIAHLIDRESRDWQNLDLGCEKAGDVIVLRMRGVPMHVGLVLGDQCMLHIEQGINSAIEKYNSGRWQQRICGLYAYNPFIETDTCSDDDFFM